MKNTLKGTMHKWSPGEEKIRELEDNREKTRSHCQQPIYFNFSVPVSTCVRTADPCVRGWPQITEQVGTEFTLCFSCLSSYGNISNVTSVSTGHPHPLQWDHFVCVWYNSLYHVLPSILGPSNILNKSKCFHTRVFTLCSVSSRSLDRCLTVSHRKHPRAPPIQPSPSRQALADLFIIAQFAFSQMSCSRRRAVCSLSTLTSFTKQNAFRIHPCHFVIY